MIKLKNNFKEINRLVLQAVDESVTEAAQEAVGQMQAEAPYVTGELADSYGYEKNGFASVEIGSTLERAAITELGGVYTPANPVMSQATADLDKVAARKFKNKLHKLR